MEDNEGNWQRLVVLFDKFVREVKGNIKQPISFYGERDSCCLKGI